VKTAVVANIVFDVAGVLLHWQPHALLRRTLASLALDEHGAHAWVPRFFGVGFGGDWGEFDRGALEPDTLAQRIARRTRLPLAEVQAVIVGIPAMLQPMSASVALVERLRARGLRLHYLSNMPAPYADALEVAHAGLFSRFDDGVFSGRVRMIKPEREIFEHAAQRFRIEPARTLFIDDWVPNVEAARALGWQALHFVDAVQCTRELAAFGL
jgi:putative hydrolase of the HAD superfamily